MSADVDHDVTVDDLFGNNREYYVTGYIRLILTVHTPEGDSYELPGTYEHVTDAENFIEDHNRNYVHNQEEEEEERECREAEEEELMRQQEEDIEREGA